MQNISLNLGWCDVFAGRVRTKTVKKASRVIIEKYYNRLTLDFDTNKRIAEEVAIIQSKRLRNKIAGFTTVSASPGCCLNPYHTLCYAVCFASSIRLMQLSTADVSHLTVCCST